MTQHDPRVTLLQMVEFAENAVKFGKGKSASEVEAEYVLLMGLTRLTEILGEAATRLPKDLRDAHPEVPWSQIIGTRNVLIHGYDVASTDVLMEIVNRDLEPLIENLRAILAEFPPLDWE